MLHVPSHDMLKRLGALATRHAQLCANLKNVHGHLTQATSRGSLPAKPVPDYSVELLDF